MKILSIVLLIIFSFKCMGSSNFQEDISAAQKIFKKATSYYEERDFENAFKFYENSAQLYFQDFNYSKYYRCKNKMAQCLKWEKKYNEALSLLEEVRKESVGKLGAFNSEASYACYIKGNIYVFGKYNYDEGIKLYKESLKFNDKNNKSSQLERSECFNSLGITYLYKSVYDKAIQNIQKSLDIKKVYYGDLDPKLSGNYINIGFGYYAKGSYNLALEYYQKAVAIEKNENLRTAICFNHIGNIYKHLKQYQLAIVYHQKALKIRKKIFGNINLQVATSYDNLGLIYKEKGLYDKALSYHKKSQSVIQKVLRNEISIDLSANSFNIGEVYELKEQYELALKFYNRAFQIDKKILGYKHSNVTESLNKISLVRLKQGNKSEALKTIQKAIYSNFLDFNDSINPYNNPTLKNYIHSEKLLESLEIKSKILIDIGGDKNLTFSLDNYNLYDSLINFNRRSHHKQKDQIIVGKKAKEIYTKAISTCLDLSENKTGEEKEQYLEKAYAFLEKNKSRVLYNTIADISAKKFGGIPDSLLEKEKELKISKSYFQQMLLEELDSAEETNCKNQIFSLNREYEALIHSLEINFPEYYNIKYNTSISTVAEVQQRLDKRSSMIQYFIGKKALYIFLISKNHFSVKKKLLNQSLEELVNNLNLGLKTENHNLFASHSNELYKLLIEPIRQELISNKLIVVPDGPLWGLSFDALISDYKRDQNFMDFDYLLREFIVSYAYSASLYVQEKNKKSKSRVINCLGFSYSNIDNATALKRGNSYQDTTSELTDLPGTRKEIAAVADIMGGTYYSGKQANEKNFKENAGNYSILHLALHGTVDEKEPMMSKLYFTDIDTLTDNEEEDNMLHAYELYNMSLKTELVVLSACKTGTGKLERGEGVMSLGRAFTYAGTKSMVMSQWNLSDYSTPIIIEGFYKYLVSGMAKDEALRSSKLDFLNQAHNLTANPYFWAGLVQIGDSNPLPNHNNNNILIFLGFVMIVSMIGFLMKN